MSSSAIVRLLGLCIDTPTALVSEYFSLGPLDAYLRTNKDKVSFSNLVEAATYIATALWDMVIYIYLGVKFTDKYYYFVKKTFIFTFLRFHYIFNFRKLQA